jgi:hypothetical protein
LIRKIISFAFFITLALNITTFSHTATIENGGSYKYKAVRLTPEIYNNAKSDLSDILVKDEKGEKVPYFINTSYQKIYKEAEQFPMSLINSYIKDDAFYFDYKVAQLPSRDIICTSIELTTKNTNFAKEIEVFGSYDNKFWEKVQDDTLYRVDGNTKLEIVFNSPQKFTYYRFKLANNLEKIVFDTVILRYNRSTSEKGYFSESITPKFSVEEKDKLTYIHIENLKHLRLAAIVLETDSMFKRIAFTPMNTNVEIYNLSFNNTTYTDTRIPLNGQISNEDILTVTINNNDDKPINIKAVTAKYFADELVFDGTNRGAIHITFGNDNNIKAPVYDISSYKDEILKGKIDKLQIKEIKLEKVQEQPKQYDYKTIFNIIIVIVALLLGALILLKLKKK